MEWVLLTDLNLSSTQLRAGTVVDDALVDLPELRRAGAQFFPFIEEEMRPIVDRFVANRRTDPTGTDPSSLFSALFILTRVQASIFVNTDITINTGAVGTWNTIKPWEDEGLSFNAHTDLEEGQLCVNTLSAATLYAVATISGPNNDFCALGLFADDVLIPGTEFEFELQGNGRPFPITLPHPVLTAPGVCYTVKIKNDTDPNTNIRIRSASLAIAT